MPFFAPATLNAGLIEPRTDASTAEVRPHLLANGECPHYIFRQVNSPESLTPFFVSPVKLSIAAPVLSMSSVVTLPLTPLFARSAL